MPHERIYSLDRDPNQLNNAQVAWGGPSSPSNTGPGHGNDEGHVMIVVERPGTPARAACSIEEIQRRLTACVEVVLAVTSRTATTERSEIDRLVQEVTDTIGLENLSYAFGSPMELLAVTIDRKGCNKMIGALRRGRDAAFGRDE
jgi:hypothetical protein